MTHDRAWRGLAAASAAALAACGGGGDDGATGGAGADTTAPTATLTAPADLAPALAGTITLAASAADDVGVAGVEFQIDGVTIGSIDTTAPYSASLDTAAYPSGQHVLRARARDGAGNLSPWSSAQVRFAGAVTQPAGFTRDQGWVSGLVNATAFAQAPDGRIFVAEQGGALRVVKNGRPAGDAVR